MRYLLFVLPILTLFACQSQMQQPVPALTTVPDSLPAEAITVAPSPTTAAAASAAEAPATMTPQSAPTISPTNEPALAATAGLPLDYPAEPTPIALPVAYPDAEPTAQSESVWGYRIVNEYPHDPLAYTQGLVIEEDLTTVLEGTGRDSSLRRVDLQTGNIQQYVSLSEQYFGEGITLFEDRIVQLTWQSQDGFVYDSETFELLQEFHYPHQGWGITHDGSQLIVSDGTDTIRFWDPESFQEVRRIQVAGENGPVTMLNELEYVDGEIWANIWHSDMVARISPEDGTVLGWIDLSGLLDPQLRTDGEAVLNGIAYDEESGRLFVTGKLWPLLFEIELVKPTGE